MTRKEKIAGQTGYKIDIITYKVNKSTGLTTDVDSRKEEKKKRLIQQIV